MAGWQTTHRRQACNIVTEVASATLLVRSAACRCAMAKQEVLRRVDLALHPGGSSCSWGATAGKTTLLLAGRAGAAERQHDSCWRDGHYPPATWLTSAGRWAVCPGTRTRCSSPRRAGLLVTLRNHGVEVGIGDWGGVQRLAWEGREIGSGDGERLCRPPNLQSPLQSPRSPGAGRPGRAPTPTSMLGAAAGVKRWRR